MPPTKGAKYLLDVPKSRTSQWLQGVLLGAALVTVGNWAANQCVNGWTSYSVFDYVKSAVGESNPEPYTSTLTEPWSKVS